MEALGRHILVEFYDCDQATLQSVEVVKNLMAAAADAAGATIVSDCFHQFNPHGVSGVIVIAESHLAIHTWPEHGYASIDLFTCGTSVNPWDAFNYLKDKMKPSHTRFAELKRGEIAPDGDVDFTEPLRINRQLIA